MSDRRMCLLAKMDQSRLHVGIRGRWNEPIMRKHLIRKLHI